MKTVLLTIAFFAQIASASASEPESALELLLANAGELTLVNPDGTEQAQYSVSKSLAKALTKGNSVELKETCKEQPANMHRRGRWCTISVTVNYRLGRETHQYSFHVNKENQIEGSVQLGGGQGNRVPLDK